MVSCFVGAYEICKREGLCPLVCLLTALLVCAVVLTAVAFVGGFVWWWVFWLAGYKSFLYFASCGVSLGVYFFGPYALPFILKNRD